MQMACSSMQFRDLATVVLTLDSAIHWINNYPADKIRETNCTIQWKVIYPVDYIFQLSNK